jgi:hypothetical protein
MPRISQTYVRATGSTTSRTLGDRFAEVFNVRDFGAVGDGTTDDSTAITAAVAAAAVSGGQVLIPQGVFRHVSEIYMENDVSIVGQGPSSVLYFDPAAGGSVWDKAAVIWEGVYPDEPTRRPAGDEHPLAIIAINSATRGATTVTCASSGDFDDIAAGDWVMVVEGSLPKWNTKIQYSKVSLRAGDTITLTRSLDFDFDGSSGGSIGVIRITPIERAWLRDLTVRGGTNGTYMFLTGLAIVGGIDHVTFEPTLTTSAQPYANDAHQFSITNNLFRQGNFGGFNRSSYCEFSHNYLPAIGATDGEYGEGASFCTYSNNWFGGKVGTNPLLGIGGGYHCSFTGNTVVGATTNAAVKVTGGSNHWISGNTFSDCYSPAISIGINGGWSTSQVVDGVEIIGNRISLYASAAASDPSISIWDYPSVKNVTVVGNIVSHQIKLGNGSATSDKRTFTLIGNVGDGQTLSVHQQMPFGAYGGYFGSTLTADPTSVSMSWEKGLYLNYTWDLSAAQLGFFITTAGTTGTLNGGGTTGSIDINTAVLTVNSATGLVPGQYISIVGVSGAKKVVSISGTTVTLDSVSNATVAAAAVSFYAPTWMPLVKRAAAQSDSVAATVADLKTDFNTLLSRLRSANVIAT